MAKKKILITGSTGFLGKNLVDRLYDKYQIIATYRKRENNFKIFESSVIEVPIDQSSCSLMHAVREFSPDVVIHTAAASRTEEGIQDTKLMIEANITTPTILLNTMRQSGVKCLINCGSSWQSCGGADFDPFNFYAVTKECFENAIDYFAIFGIKAITFRLFDTYGPNDDRSKILNLLIDAAVNQEKIDVSPGYQELSLVHIEDVCDAFELAADYLSTNGDDGGFHKRFCVKSDEMFVLRDLADMISKANGTEIDIKWGGRKYREREIMKPASKYPTFPGWTQKIKIEDGIGKILERKIEDKYS